MKKFLVLVLIVALSFSLIACSTSEPEAVEQPAQEAEATPEPEVEEVATEEPVAVEESTEAIKIATLAGPTGMGLVNLANDESGKYEVEVLTQPDQITPKIINGEVDIATIPSNLGAVLFNKMQGGISVVAVNTKGVLYLIGNKDNEEITSFKDLDGKEFTLTGQGASPEYIVNDLLAKNEAEATINFMSAHADLSNAMVSSDVELGILPEPFVSITLAQSEGLTVLSDLNEEWQAVYGGGVEIPMGIAIANNEFLENNPEAFEEFMSDYSVSIDYVNNDTVAAAEDIVKAGIFAKAPIIVKSVPRCGISLVTGSECKDMLENYFEVLFESNPKSVGGSLPSEEFYYQK